MKINELQLPSKLIDLISKNEWTVPDRHENLKNVFSDRISLNCMFYTYDLMMKETKSLVKDYIRLGSYNKNIIDLWPLTNNGEFYWFGRPDDKIKPGTLDATKAVIIGDMGVDSPICLDYRISLSQPRVVWLAEDSLWQEVSPNIESFVQSLKLG